jgi:hypothetical protein
LIHRRTEKRIKNRKDSGCGFPESKKKEARGRVKDPN